jgi:hypothetical protein
MIYRMLDSDGDYVFGRGKHAYLEGIEAVAQAIKTRLLLLYSEWWEDREDGLPLWEQILSAPASEDSLTAVDLLFKERIENTTGVLSLLGYESSFDRERRKYTFTAAVETMYGELIVSNTGVSE